MRLESKTRWGCKQVVYSDVLSRPVKTVTYKDDNPFTMVVTDYNARDQVTNIKQYAGATTTSTSQETVLEYDGHARLKSRKVPAATAPAFYDYYADDQLKSVKDARGAVATYSYNSRHLVKEISYAVASGSNITVPSAVSFSYDDAGNRTGMKDGLGSATYHYDTLSRLTSEDRLIDDPDNSLNQTFANAIDRLNKKKDCAKLFGGLQKALDTLNSATYRLFNVQPIPLQL